MNNTATRSWLSTFVFLACLFTFTTAWAGAEDDYLRIYAIIDDADGLSAKGKTDLAQSKYAEAHKELIAFKKTNPAWNKSTVAYRINYVAEKLAPQEEVAKPHATSTSAPQSDSMTATPAASGPQVKLISAGSEPRKALRLHPAVGDKQSFTMTLKIDMDMGAAAGGMPAMKMPATEISADTTVRSVAPDGDITYDMIYTEFGTVGGVDSSNPLSGMMADGMKSLKGTKATGIVTDRGAMRSMEFKLPEEANPMFRQSLEQSKEGFSQISLPVDAVGVGAKWEMKEKKKARGMTLDETATFEITAIEGNIVKLRMTMKQEAANQKIESPAMPGMKMDLSTLVSEGSGTATVDLSKAMPAQSDFTMKSETSMNMNIGGQKQPINMKMDMTIRIESK